jgi:hypothetical protein
LAIYYFQEELPGLGALVGFVGNVSGTHNYLAVVNHDGCVVCELQGESKNAFTIGAITIDGDYLRVENQLPGSYMADMSLVQQPVLVIYGSEEAIYKLYTGAFSVVENALDNTHDLYSGAQM